MVSAVLVVLVYDDDDDDDDDATQSSHWLPLSDGQDTLLALFPVEYVFDVVVEMVVLVMEGGTAVEVVESLTVLTVLEVVVGVDHDDADSNQSSHWLPLSDGQDILLDLTPVEYGFSVVAEMDVVIVVDVFASSNGWALEVGNEVDEVDELDEVDEADDTVNSQSSHGLPVTLSEGQADPLDV